MKLSKDTILKDIKNIGVQVGDIIFVNANIVSVGFIYKNGNETLKKWIEILLEAVGDEGTIVMAAYTKFFLKFKKNNNIVFDTYTKTTSGALAQAFLNDDRAVRSTHPTNSYVGLGKHATEILNAHTPHSKSYSVMDEINKRDGKYLMIGTLDSENCPINMHYAQ